MFNSLQPHRRQPTRLPRPWDSPGKNTGVGCHFLLQCMKVKSESDTWGLVIFVGRELQGGGYPRHCRLWCVLVAQSGLILCNPMDCSPPDTSVHGKDTGERCHALLQGIFLTQRLNMGFLHYRQILYRLSHQGRIAGYLAPLSVSAY